MAWRSSGTNNAEMVDKLKRYGVISNDHVEGGFRRVDRKFFVPRGNENIAHSDQPLKEGNIHISAPHIYGSAIEALDLVPNSSTSFLNIGCGTGYISCIVAEILGPNSLNYGVELHDDVIHHCKASIAKWKSNVVDDDGSISTIRFMDNTADIKLIKGNGLNIIESKGESVAGFDRIYIGAAVDKQALANITKLLSPGGILVGPVDDELVKITRVGKLSPELEKDAASDSRLVDKEFTSQILSGVRFAPLVTLPSLTTTIPSSVWNPSIQRSYPPDFQQASMELLLCSNSCINQPPPRQPRPDELFNAAAMLPRALWVEILSYTHRKWFEPEQNETEYLKRRLREEKAKAAQAERSRKEADERCLALERECALSRLLARRWQSRLNALLSQQDQQGDDGQRSELFDGGARGINLDNRYTLSGLRLMLQQISGGHGEDEESVSVDEGARDEREVEEMDEEVDESEEEHYVEDEDDLLDLLADENESDAEEMASDAEGDTIPNEAVASVDENDSVVMEDVSNSIGKGYRSIDQPRTISVSSDDL